MEQQDFVTTTLKEVAENLQQKITNAQNPIEVEKYLDLLMKTLDKLNEHKKIQEAKKVLAEKAR